MGKRRRNSRPTNMQPFHRFQRNFELSFEDSGNVKDQINRRAEKHGMPMQDLCFLRLELLPSLHFPLPLSIIPHVLEKLAHSECNLILMAPW